MRSTRVKKMEKKHKAYFLLAAIWIISLLAIANNVFALDSIKLVSNTDSCFDCETTYQICPGKDSIKSFDINFIKGKYPKTNVPYELWKIEEKQIYETNPVYEDTLKIIDGKTVTDKKQIGTENTLKTVTEKTKTTKTDLFDSLSNAKDGDCVKFSIKGSLKQGESLDNVLVVNGVSYSQWVWWDNTFNVKYPLNITEPASLTRTNEPLKINVSTVGCAYGDKRDLRLLLNDSLEIPIQILSDNQTMVTTLNISAGFSGTIGYLYCNSTTAAAPTYTTGYTATLLNNKTARVRMGDIFGSKYDFLYGTLQNVSVSYATGWNYTTGHYGGLTAKCNSGNTYYTCTDGNCLNVKCVLLENGSVYSKILCDNQGVFFEELEFYYNNPLFKYSPSLLNSYTCNIGYYMLGGASSAGSTWRQYVNHTNQIQSTGVTARTTIETNKTTSGAGLWGQQPLQSGQDMGIAFIFNWSLMFAQDPNNRYGHIEANNNPTTSYNFMFSSTQDGNNGFANLSRLGSTAGRSWYGYVNTSDVTGLTNLMAAKMSPVVYAVGSGELNFNPSIVFDSIQPVNLTLTNVITSRVNITFNTTDINLSLPANLTYSTNGTTNILFVVNGTTIYNPQTKQCPNISATRFTCQLNDNDMLNAVYNYNQTVMQSATLVSLKAFNNANDRLKTQFVGYTPASGLGFVEINCNGSAAAPMNVYYYNSSNASVLLATIPGNASFDHRHSSYSAHHVVPLPLNATLGTVAGVKATQTFYVEIRGSSGANFECYGLTNITRPDAVQSSINAGVSYSNVAGTTDTHLHVFEPGVTFYYQAQATATDGTAYQSLVFADPLELFAIPPTTPEMATVSDMIQNTTQAITWSRSYSPQGTNIKSYLVDLYQGAAFVRSVINQTGLSYPFNGSDALGIYQLHVYAIDDAALVSGVFVSNSFNISEPCQPNFNCTSFGACQVTNITACLVVTDLNCGTPFNGTLSDYNANCTYVPPAAPGSGTNINTQEGAFVFGVLVFLWLALLVLTLIFRNLGIAILCWMVGVFVGIVIGNQYHATFGLLFLLMDSVIILFMGKLRRN